jgi:DNA-binding NarL/FixJ family response regulator
MPRARTSPVRVALIDDYDVVVIGLAHMFDAYSDRVVVAEIDTNMPTNDRVDIALYDTFAQPEADRDDFSILIDHPHARRAVIYTWNFNADLIAIATQRGASGYLSKTLPAHALVAALEQINAGTVVVSPDPGKSRTAVGLDWPGRAEGLTNREAEILALITQGKIGVESRTQAVLWGVDHGFKPNHHRIDHWRNGP